MSTSFTKMCNLAGFDPYIVYEGNGMRQYGGHGAGHYDRPYSINLGVQKLGVERTPIPNIPLADDFAASEIGIVHRKGQIPV